MKPANRKPSKRPLKAANPEPVSRPAAGTPTPPSIAPKAARKRILLVDDDPVVRESLAELLLIDGYEVIPAKDGQQAVDLAAHTAVDLVLLDLNMPVKNGWDTFDQLTREHPLLPVIIVTGRAN